MKRIRFMAWGAIASTFVIIACQREQSFGTKDTLQLMAKSTAKVGESVSFSLQNNKPGTVSRWSINPSSGFRIDSIYSYGNNSITFTQPGSYVVSVTVKPTNISLDSLPRPYGDSLYHVGDSGYYQHYDSTTYHHDSTAYHHIDSCYHHVDSSFHHVKDSVRVFKTITVNY